PSPCPHPRTSPIVRLPCFLPSAWNIFPFRDQLVLTMIHGRVDLCPFMRPLCDEAKDAVAEFFKQLLSPDFMPHGYCYLWDPGMVWLNVISDALITLSYYCIPIVLIYFVLKNRDIPFNRIFWMFGTFILACGTTHLMEIWNIWHASYLL